MATIVRGPRAADNFTMISNAALRDERLSWKARGLLAYLLSMKTGWDTSVRRLAGAAPDGKSAVETALTELEALGYLSRRQTRAEGDEAGRFSVTEYYVCDESTVTRLSVDGSSVPGESATKKTSSKKTSPEEELKSSSAALRAATATPVETPRSSSSSVTREDAAAATSPSEEHGDASRANPDKILSTMMLNPDEAGRFRAWLVAATNATNPDGLIVTLHTSGSLSKRLAQWRESENTARVPTPAHGATRPRTGHLDWCGRCDSGTRTLTATDQDGTEYIRRCPTCNINAGNPTPGSGASQAIAQQAALAAANRSAAGREAFLAARAALPQGTARRTTTIGDTIEPEELLKSEMADA